MPGHIDRKFALTTVQTQYTLQHTDSFQLQFPGASSDPACHSASRPGTNNVVHAFHCTLSRSVVYSTVPARGG